MSGFPLNGPISMGEGNLKRKTLTMALKYGCAPLPEISGLKSQTSSEKSLLSLFWA